MLLPRSMVMAESPRGYIEKDVDGFTARACDYRYKVRLFGLRQASVVHKLITPVNYWHINSWYTMPNERGSFSGTRRPASTNFLI